VATKLTQAEADMLIEMLKREVEKSILEFPAAKGKLSFDVIGERRTDEFVVNIDRKGINAQGCTYQGRIKSNNIVLLRLDVNLSAIHVNPSTGEKVRGTHLHIYTEKYELGEAIPFDITGKDIYSLCYTFFERFNIIEPPQINYQYTLTNEGCE
jgi:hypothetical protein